MKKKYYLTLDTETASLPFLKQICHNAKDRKKIAIAKPLVYDIGWVIKDRTGNIVKTENYLVQETFFVPTVFNTAYYREKRPIYMQLLKDGKIAVANWDVIVEVLLEDLQTVDISTAFNAQFDFKRAIPFTEKYIRHLYDVDYDEWERKQYGACKAILDGVKPENPEYMLPFFKLRGEQFPIADIWDIACQRLVNIDKYKTYCLENSLLTESSQFFKTSAETVFQYLMKQYDFIEEHTALSDALIESEMLTKALKKGKVEAKLQAFPFRNLGTTIDYVREKKPKYKQTVIDSLEKYIEANDGYNKAENSSYWSKMVNTLNALEE